MVCEWQLLHFQLCKCTQMGLVLKIQDLVVGRLLLFMMITLTRSRVESYTQQTTEWS